MDNKTINDFITKALNVLEGEWILVGGSLLLALDLSKRVTVDIDILPVETSTNQSMLALMKISEELGMPVETINMAAEYFLKKIPDWKKELIVFKKGKNCILYRPSKKLFQALKEGRGTETDMLDIEIYNRLK